MFGIRNLAVVMASALGAAILTTPVAVAEEASEKISMDCHIKPGSSERFTSNVVGKYDKSYGLKFNMTVDAPAEATLGSSVTYKVKVAEADLRNPILLGFWGSTPLQIKSLSQGRMTFDLPENIENPNISVVTPVASAGVQIDGSSIVVKGDKDTDNIPASEAAIDMIAALEPGGMTGEPGSTTFKMASPSFDLTFTPTKAGKFSPSIRRHSVPAGENGFPAENAFFTAMANMTYNKTNDFKALIRCSPSAEVTLPAVQVVSDVNAVNSVTLTAEPKTVENGQKVTFNATALNDQQQPVAGAPVTIEIGEEKFSGVTGANGIFSHQYQTTKIGSLTAVAKVGDKMSQPVEVQVTKPAPVAGEIRLSAEPAEVTSGKDVVITAQLIDNEGQPFAADSIEMRYDRGDRVTVQHKQGDPVGQFVHTFTTDRVGDIRVDAYFGSRLTKRIDVKVNPKPADVLASISVAPETQTVKIGTEATLTATVLAQDGSKMTGKNVTFEVDGKSTPAQEGPAGSYVFTYTAATLGEKTITAKVEDKSAEAKVVVEEEDSKIVESITLTPRNATIKLGETATVDATVLARDGSKMVGQDVQFTYNGKTVRGTETDGVYSFTFSPTTLGDHTVTATVSNKTATATVVVADQSQNGGSADGETIWKIVAGVLGTGFFGGVIYAILRYFKLVP